MSNFPSEIVSFGTLFIQMQIRRHAADYNPQAESFLKSEVQAELQTAKQAIGDFNAISKKDRRAFASYVLMKDRGE